MIRYGMKLKKLCLMSNLLFDFSKTRLVMLDDVVSIKGSLEKNLFDNSIKDYENVHKKRPSKCTRCKSSNVLGVEIMGAYDGILFWECDICENTILRFKKDLTEKYLQLAKGLWTNPSDWGYVPPSKFN